MKKQILFAMLATTFFHLAPATDAQAMCCVMYYDHEDSKEQTKTIISTLSEKINAMQLAIIEALRLGAGQQSGNSKEQIGAQSNMANVNDDRRVVGNVEMARFNVIKSAASGASSCNSTTSGIATGGLNNNVMSLSNSLTNDLVDWDVGGSEQLPSYRGTDVAIQSRIERHCSTYANADDKRSGLCPSASPGEMASADIDVSRSIFGKKQGSESHTYDSKRQDAATTFMINAFDPRPQGGMLALEANGPGGKEKAGARLASAARLSIAKYAAADILARRAPQNNQQLTKWAQGTAAQISGYTGADFSSGVSWTDAMDIRARGWFQNGNWGTAVGSQGAEQATKDTAHMVSFQVYLQWETFKLIEKQNLMLASMLAIQTEQARGTVPSSSR